MLIDLITDKKFSYELILCKTNRTKLSVLDEAMGIQYDRRWPTTDELTFDIPYYITRNNKTIVNPNFDLIKSDYQILCNIKLDNTIIEAKYFTIMNPKISVSDKEIKNIQCYSLEYKLNNKNIRSYTFDGRCLYSPTNEVDSDGYQIGIMNYISTLISWSLDTTAFSALTTKYRSIDISDQSVFDVLVNTLQELFEVVFLFDTVNKQISVDIIDNLQIDSTLYLNESNYIKSLSEELKYDEVITRLYCYGKDNLPISSVNPSGGPYIEDFTCFKTTDYMSQSLIDALDAYDALLINYPSKTENNVNLVSYSSKFKANLNSIEANAYKSLVSVTVGASTIDVDDCTFVASNPTSIGDANGKINITIDDAVTNKETYTVEVVIASGANADMTVALNSTNLLITLGTGSSAGVVDNAKNLTMYISGAINLISGFEATVETHGVISTAQTQSTFQFNYILIDDTITLPATASIVFKYDTFENLNNQYLDLMAEKVILQDELDVLIDGYYELDINNESVLLVDGLNQIQDKISYAIPNNWSLTADPAHDGLSPSYNARLSAMETLVMNKQLEINTDITDQDIIDIFNNHYLYSATSTYALGDLVIYYDVIYQCVSAITVAEVWNASHWTTTITTVTTIQSLIDTKVTEIANYRTSISKTSNFTSAQILELDEFVKEKVWTDSNYENAQDLYDEGVVKLTKQSTPGLEFEIDVVDFLQTVGINTTQPAIVDGVETTTTYNRIAIDGKADRTKLIPGYLVKVGFD